MSSNFHTEIKGDSFNDIKLCIVSCCCILIKNNEIKKNDWQNLIDIISLKFKSLKYPLSDISIIKEFEKINLNYENFSNEIPNKVLDSLQQKNKPCYYVIDWLAYVNSTSTKITSSINQETVIRNLLSEAFDNSHKCLNPESKKNVEKDTINSVLSYAIINNKYSNNIKKKMK